MVYNSVLSRAIATLGLAVLHYVVGSVIFDLVHWQAHRKSRHAFARWLRRAHSAHHQYFDRNLKFNSKFRRANLMSHLPLEFVCQIMGSTLSWLVMRTIYTTAAYDLLLALAVQIIRAATVAWNMGHDSNHIPYKVVPKDGNKIIVGPAYHVLHHMDPQNYFGSMVRLIDVFLGTAATLKGRRVAMTGSGGALGRALIEALQKEQVASVTALRHGVEWSVGNYARLLPILTATDILILCHGTKDADTALAVNCNAAVSIIQLFKHNRVCARPELVPEVWYIGSEAELHGALPGDKVMRAYAASKRAFVPFAKRYYKDEAIVYRHIVPAAFRSRLGSAIVGADWAAKEALWWIRRGAQYVPVTYTGLAFLNYWRFMYWVTPAPEPSVVALSVSY